uniref:Uncharacterized protein n=1 Tax=Fagus sylvatica TaxID=28930 RepID=A0A2N9F4P3_FAGSY
MDDVSDATSLLVILGCVVGSLPRITFGTTFKAKGVHILFCEGWREGKATRVEEVVFVKKGGTFYGKVLGTPKAWVMPKSVIEILECWQGRFNRHRVPKAARNNVLLAVPALLYAINNYLKFIMQLYFNPATVKLLSNMKVTVPSMASVFNEYALKSQFETSIYLQVRFYLPLIQFSITLPPHNDPNLFLYGYGAMFNLIAILGIAIFKGPGSLDILEGHSKATMLLICNNAAQGILSSFFFKYADTILKKYSSNVATIFTGIASAALFGHTLTINFVLGISIVFISMHQFFSPLSKIKDEPQNGNLEIVDNQNNQRSKDTSFVNMAAGANEDASHLVGHDEKAPLLPH